MRVNNVVFNKNCNHTFHHFEKKKCFFLNLSPTSYLNKIFFHFTGAIQTKVYHLYQQDMLSKVFGLFEIMVSYNALIQNLCWRVTGKNFGSYDRKI